MSITSEESTAANRDFWNKAVDFHLQSDFYNMPSFLQGHTSLKHIELGLLGDIAGKSVLHLQCHFGQDTLSLQRMGAQCTGVDFSEAAVREAKALNKLLGLEARFICSDVLALQAIHEHEYDIVYTTYGTVGWLHDINKWAATVAAYLKPGGRLVMVDFHPAMWMLDNDLNAITYSYFNDAPIHEQTTGSYASPSNAFDAATISYNHSLASIMQGLIDCNLELVHFAEYNYSPYNCLHGMKQIATEKFIVEKYNGNLPLLYSLVLEKK